MKQVFTKCRQIIGVKTQKLFAQVTQLSRDHEIQLPDYRMTHNNVTCTTTITRPSHLRQYRFISTRYL